MSDPSAAPTYAPPPLPPQFEYRDGELWLEGVRLSALAASVSTPAYAYSAAAIANNYRSYASAMAAAVQGRPVQICFAVKALPTLGVLQLLAALGCGADVVSLGELRRATRAGIPPSRIVFAGVGKTAAEIDEALSLNILALNVESEAELEHIEARARAAGKVARVSLRVNPDVEVHTHAYITTGQHFNKFGLPLERALRAAHHAAASPHLRLVGLHCHIGSQLLELAPFSAAVRAVVQLALTVEAQCALRLELLNLGGGLGVAYRLASERTAAPAELAARLQTELGGSGRDWTLVLEPGRWLVANAGALLTQVLYVKQGGAGPGAGPLFAIVDAAMNDLLRPALYQAHHELVPLAQPAAAAPARAYDVVGPVCESGDFLARARSLPPLAAGAGLAVLSAGAYGASMASNYNTRPRAPEVLVEGAQWRLVRQRESTDDLMRLEQLQ